MFLAALGAGLPGMVDAQTNPLVGTWNLLPDKSTGPARYKSMTLKISGAGDMVEVEGTDVSGKPVKQSYTIVTDGKPHPVEGIPDADTATWTRYSDTNTSYQYNKGKNIMLLGARSLSADHKTLTFREQLYDRNGKQLGTSILVFDNPDVKVASVAPASAAPVPVVPAGPTADEKAGAAALEANNNDEAIAAFTRALDKKEKGYDAHYDYVMRGVAFGKKNDFAKAMADFDEAVKLKDDDADVRFRRGAIRFQQRDYKGTVEDMSVVIKADDKNGPAYRMRGFSLNMLDQRTEGAADNDKACELSKDLCP
jgi:tetratricopeptide (TPR) repeat protein